MNKELKPNKQLIILLDTNILLNTIRENWHLNSLIESQLLELYKIVVPNLIVNELKNVKEKVTVKNGAVRLAEHISEIIDESKFLNERDYNKKIDDQLLLLAIRLSAENKVIIMTQDIKFKNKIIGKGIPVLLVSYGKAKLLKKV